MSKPIEFGKFYKLLSEVKAGSLKDKQDLDWMLAEYEHATDSNSAYDELGQIFCHIGLMELYAYTGADDITYISELEKAVWDYLQKRYGSTLLESMVIKMKKHSAKHKLAERVSIKWELELSEINQNIDGLANYVAEGIIEVLE